MKKLILLPILLLTMACGNDSSVEFESSLKFVNEGLIESFTDALDREGIKYIINDDNTVSYDSGKTALVKELMYETIRDDLPEGRSINLVLPGLREKVISKLDRENINYIIKKRFNADWIVWLEGDSTQVNEIIKNLQRRQLDTLMDEEYPQNN